MFGVIVLCCKADKNLPTKGNRLHSVPAFSKWHESSSLYKIFHMVFLLRPVVFAIKYVLLFGCTSLTQCVLPFLELAHVSSNLHLVFWHEMNCSHVVDVNTKKFDLAFFCNATLPLQLTAPHKMHFYFFRDCELFHDAKVFSSQKIFEVHVMLFNLNTVVV